MKAKMTVYQNGGKAPIDPKKRELAKELFGSIPKFDKEAARYGMMGERIKELQKEYDHWVNKGERTAASGVKVQMDAIRSKMADLKTKMGETPEKKYAGGGKVNIAGAKESENVYDYMGYKKKKNMSVFKDGGKWIQKALAKHKEGSLHKQLGVAADKKIPMGKLEKAAEAKGKLGKRARLALTLRKLNK